MKGGPLEKALNCAFMFLCYQARSKEELRIKLAQMGFSEKSIKATLDRLRVLNVLNDENFARGWALGSTKSREYGPLRIQKELRQ